MEWAKIKLSDDVTVSVSRSGLVVRDKGPLGPSYDTEGRAYVSIRTPPRTLNRYIHRLVAQAFLPNPHGLTFVSFRNGDARDVRPKNLRWTNYRSGAARKPAKLSDVEVHEVRRLALIGTPLHIIADAYGVSASLVSHIKAGRKR